MDKVITAWSYSPVTWQALKRPLVPERALLLYINGVKVAVIMRLPGLEHELALGYCYDEGMLLTTDAVRTVSYRPGTPDEIEMVVDSAGLKRDTLSDVPRMVMAVAGVVQTAGLEPLTVPCEVLPERLMALPGLLDAAQVQRRETGGTHAAGLFAADDEWHVVCEDIGRHNAVDKCVGTALRVGSPLEKQVLLCTGRLSYEMVSKAIRARIPFICTLAVPTALAVSLAERYGVTLVSRLGEEGFQVHSHPEHITGWAGF